MATLSVDQPGVGESALGGVALTGRGDVELCARASLDYLQQRGHVRSDAIGAFGMSLGGFYAPCSALVVHGTKDELIPVADARALAQTMGGPTELLLVEGGDHSCSRTLASETVPYIFDWFAEQLGANGGAEQERPSLAG